MKRKECLLVVLAVVIVPLGSMARADELGSSSLSRAQWVETQLNFYTTALVAQDNDQIAIQPAYIRAALSNFSGVLVQDAFVLNWNAVSGEPELWQRNRRLALTSGVDDCGRITFTTNGGELRGSIDVFGGNLVVIRVALETGRQYIWLGEISYSAKGVAMVNSFGKTQCTCKGSNNQCSDPDTDCTNEQPCSYTDAVGNNHNSTCKWLIVPNNIIVFR